MFAILHAFLAHFDIFNRVWTSQIDVGLDFLPHECRDSTEILKNSDSIPTQEPKLKAELAKLQSLLGSKKQMEIILINEL